MQPTDARIAMRPRPAWEALDLGILLAGRHRRLLMLSWALVTLPILGLLTLLLWDWPEVAFLLFWWLKPLYERLPLLIVSQALFGAAPSLAQALKAWPATLRTQWLPSLLWRRLSLSRSFTLPVQQLEGLCGAERARRVAILCQGELSAARSLTLVGAHLEMILYIGLIAALYALVPRQLDIGWHWLVDLENARQQVWVDHLLNLLYALVLIVWEPVYVTCGFMLYLNRRTRLEAWDIEQVFRRLRQRLASTATVLLLGCGLLMASLPSPGWAASEPGPDSPRLTHQPLNSQQARQSIGQLLEQPPFRNPQTVSGWRFPEAEKTGQATDTDSPRLIDALARLLEGASTVARLLEVVLWGLAFAVLAWLAWHCRHWRNLFGKPQGRRRSTAPAAPRPLFGLQVAADSLPEDVAGTAQALWASDPRSALGLLYRALLSRLVEVHGLALGSADTEGQVLERIDRLDNPSLSAFCLELTTHWQNLAYGHRLPPDGSEQRMCNGWRELFDERGQP